VIAILAIVTKYGDGDADGEDRDRGVIVKTKRLQCLYEPMEGMLVLKRTREELASAPYPQAKQPAIWLVAVVPRSVVRYLGELLCVLDDQEDSENGIQDDQILTNRLVNDLLWLITRF
jgi:hypothetical protein